jgi:hypothetical protein
MDKLKDIYYNPKTGYLSLNQLWKKLIENKIYLPYNDVKDWYEQQSVNQIYKQTKPLEQYHVIKSPFNSIGCFQMDLMVTERFYRENKGYKYILNIIDIYSRRAFSFLLKKKTPDEIAPFVEQVIKTTLEKQKVALFFTMDNGSEFRSDVEDIFKKYNVQVYLNDPHSSNAKRQLAVVERFNRTLLNRIKKYMYSNNTLVYYDVLDDLVYNYNNSVHSTIKEKPISVWNAKVRPQNIEPEEYDDEEPFKVGNIVRHKKVHPTFTKKGFEPIYSLKTYTVEDKKGFKYLLSNGKYYLPEELVIATDTNDNNFRKTLKENKKEIKKERTYIIVCGSYHSFETSRGAPQWQ